MNGFLYLIAAATIVMMLIGLNTPDHVSVGYGYSYSQGGGW